MQSSKLLRTSKPDTKSILFIFLPILVAISLQFATITGDWIVLFIKNIISDRRYDSDISIETIISNDYNQPMNKAFMTLVQYLLFLIAFGIWYLKAFIKDADIKANIKKVMSPKLVMLLILGGYGAQLFVDGVLILVRPFFKSAFETYDAMVSNVTGVNSSWVMLLAVILLAPIGEELLFRGLVQSYALKTFKPWLSILIQALFFGLYHSNPIQSVYAFVMGTALGIIAYKLDSIIPTIILHISINFSLLLVPEALYRTTLSTVITTAISGLVFVGIIWLVINNKKREI